MKKFNADGTFPAPDPNQSSTPSSGGAASAAGQQLPANIVNLPGAPAGSPLAQAQQLYANHKELFILDSSVYSFISTGNSTWYGTDDLKVIAPDPEVRKHLTGLLYQHRRFAKATFRVLQRSNPYITAIESSLDHAEGCMKIEFPPIEDDIDDDKFILDWLRGLFPDKTHYEFILDWMAVYAYTNENLENNLPILIFTGPRGCGKSTLAQVLMKMFPGLGAIRPNASSSFTGEYGKKLLVMDEVQNSAKGLYQKLKEIGGSQYLKVNTKYGPSFEVPNNLKVVLTSNNPVPVDFVSDELPPDEASNGYFVYTFPSLPKGGQVAGLQRDIEARLGHFIDSLSQRFFRLHAAGALDTRYSLLTPITDDQKRMFGASRTELQEDADAVYEAFRMPWEDKTGKSCQPILQNGRKHVLKRDFELLIKGMDLGSKREAIKKTLIDTGKLHHTQERGKLDPLTGKKPTLGWKVL